MRAALEVRIPLALQRIGLVFEETGTKTGTSKAGMVETPNNSRRGQSYGFKEGSQERHSPILSPQRTTDENPSLFRRSQSVHEKPVER